MSRRTPPPHAVVAISFLATITLVACGSAEQSPQALSRQPVVVTTPALADVPSLRLPVEAFKLTSADLAVIERTRVKLVTTCLARFGVSVTLPPPVDASAYGPVSLTDRRYGITDDTLAARHGFGLGPRDPALQPKPSQPTLSPDGRTALTGQGPSEIHGIAVPKGGCLAQADRELDADLPAGVNQDLPQRLQFDSFEQSKKDPAVLAVFKNWSACMAEAGYRYNTPLDSVADPRFTELRPASAEAIRVARADIRCKQRTNLVGVWFGVDSAYEQLEIRQRSESFQLALRAAQSRLSRARTVLDAAH